MAGPEIWAGVGWFVCGVGVGGGGGAVHRYRAGGGGPNLN